MLPPLRCAISPDADDLFMFRALFEGLVDREGLSFEIVTRDTELLNRMARGDDAPDISAISVAAYPLVAERYQLLAHGGSVGRGYGPVLIARPGEVPPLRGGRPRISVPGLTTTAHLVTSLLAEFEPVVIPITPPARTFAALRDREVDAAVVIHEGRLTYPDEGFVLVADLGVEWARLTGGLPLPLGGNVIRRDLGAERIAAADRVLRASIAHGLAHRDEAIAWLLERSTTLHTPEQVDHYLSLYANADTLDYGVDGRAAIGELLRRGAAAGVVPPVTGVDLVGDPLPIG